MKTNIDVNPVEVIKKDIYLIKNKINNKVYIGQAINTSKRIQAHIQGRNKDGQSLIHMAIEKYGWENFSVTILENQIENYNVREKYWIKFYNSLAPNGYNILPGGEEPPVYKGVKNNRSKFTLEDVEEIKRLLKTTVTPITVIAKQFGVSFHTISHINSGICYKSEHETYPLRSFQISGEFDSCVKPEIADKIIDLLQNSTKSFMEIATICSCTLNQVYSINLGLMKMYYRDELIYPIRMTERQNTKQNLIKIKNYLKENKYSYEEIAKMCNTKYNIVTAINRGECGYDPSEHYPISTYSPFRWQLSEEQFEQIRRDLKEGHSNKFLRKKYHINNGLIADINSGKTHKNNAYTYPLRESKLFITESQLREIYNLIQNTQLTFREIGRQYNVSFGFIQQLNLGKQNKYRREDLHYPLRKR